MGYFNWGLTERQSTTIKSFFRWCWVLIVWSVLIALVYFVLTLIILPALSKGACHVSGINFLVKSHMGPYVGTP